MNRTDSPAKQPKPFGVNGPREPLLSTTPAGDNTASYDAGFPPITMTLKSAGGLPPKGQDMNQILYELSALCRWASAGAINTYDSAFASSIGGYPSGSYVLGNDLKTVYRCTTDGNTANPNSVTTGWAKVAQDIADILALGTASTRNVGIGTNQIPDMSFFGGTSSSSGYQYFPNGNLIQWGTIGLNSSPSGTTIGVFPIAFPSTGYQIVVTHDNPLDSTLAYGAASIISPTQFRVNACAINTSTFTLNPGYAMTLRWIAIGK